MIGWTLLALVVVLVLFVLLSPLESLQWWVAKGEREVAETFDVVAPEPGLRTPARHYIVYLSGVGTIGGDELSGREEAWLQSLRDELPEARVVGDVFPYAVDNRGLRQRATVWLWGRLHRWRRKGRALFLPFIIELRNIAQVLVSADPRYGPTYNIGLAQELWRSLQRQGYVPGSGAPVTLVGFSGGAQVALGAGWYLSGLGVPVTVISVGGIFGDDPGLDRVRHLWHLSGSRDKLQHLGTVAFPGRWPTAPLSPWAKAKREGRVTTLDVGPMEHSGANGYLGRRAVGEDGRNHAEVTRDVVIRIVRGWTSPGVRGGPSST
ncbi:MAG: hypothetical protein GX596_01190 [Propionibacterium sp.]|nr:hypothetical protein [Propionibacterium sp.]